MPAPYYYLLGAVLSASDACHNDGRVADALDKAGLAKARQRAGAELAAHGQALIKRRTALGGDRISDHNVHLSADEVGMWRRTTLFVLGKAVDDAGLLAQARAEDLHGTDHSVTVAAQALRLIALLRAEPRVHETLGHGQRTRDIVNRGWTLLRKMFNNGELLMSPGAAGNPGDAVFADLAEARTELQAWLLELDAAARKIAAQPEVLARLGYVPDNVGLPVGGASYAVTLHESARRAEPPDLSDLRPDPGWSAGRQGRNRENLGKGWVEPKFK